MYRASPWTILVYHTSIKDPIDTLKSAPKPVLWEINIEQIQNLFADLYMYKTIFILLVCLR